MLNDGEVDGWTIEKLADEADRLANSICEHSPIPLERLIDASIVLTACAKRLREDKESS